MICSPLVYVSPQISQKLKNGRLLLIPHFSIISYFTKAEQLITDVLLEAEAGGSGVVSRRLIGQSGVDKFVMKILNNKVGLK